MDCCVRLERCGVDGWIAAQAPNVWEFAGFAGQTLWHLRPGDVQLMELPWSTHALSFISAAVHPEHAAQRSTQAASFMRAAVYPERAAQRWSVVIDQAPTHTTSPRYTPIRRAQTNVFTPNSVDPTHLVWKVHLACISTFFVFSHSFLFRYKEKSLLYGVLARTSRSTTRKRKEGPPIEHCGGLRC